MEASSKWASHWLWSSRSEVARSEGAEFVVLLEGTSAGQMHCFAKFYPVVVSDMWDLKVQ